MNNIVGMLCNDLCSLTSAEGETKDSNIDLGFERMVNVLTQPVLFFVSHVVDCLGGGAEGH